IQRPCIDQRIADQLADQPCQNRAANEFQDEPQQLDAYRQAQPAFGWIAVSDNCYQRTYGAREQHYGEIEAAVTRCEEDDFNAKALNQTEPQNDRPKTGERDLDHRGQHLAQQGSTGSSDHIPDQHAANDVEAVEHVTQLGQNPAGRQPDESIGEAPDESQRDG